MQEHFYGLADSLAGKLRGGEVLLLNFSGEQSDFVRFNHGLVRQAGSVRQGYLTLDLIEGRRHAKATVGIAGSAEADRPRCDALLAELRDRVGHVPEDPYLLYAAEVASGEQVRPDRLPDSAAAVDAILAAASGKPGQASRSPLDMVGIYAQGGIFAGFANSLGQRNWFASYSFQADWSLYLRQDKAVKTQYAGFEWDQAAFRRKADAAAEQLAVLDRPPKTVEPGEYRAYLAPAAMQSLLEMLCWGGFGLKAHRTKTTCLLKMIEEAATLHPSVTLRENTREGIAANFQSSGFIKPDEVVLIENGRYRDCLVSPRSGGEYGVAPNGAGDGEAPESLELGGGDVGEQQILPRLDTGVYANQLWYLNYSDLPGGRITGMTRFATFWVEGGRIVAPLNVMRFDETIYRALGENLLGLTERVDFIPDAGTYGGRSSQSVRTPGALIDRFRFTL